MFIPPFDFIMFVFTNNILPNKQIDEMYFCLQTTKEKVMNVYELIAV